MTTLYELSSTYANLAQTLEDCEPEVIALALANIEGAIEVKAGNIVKLMKSWEAEEGIMKAEEDRLKARREASVKRREALKKHLEEQLLVAGLERVKTPTHTLSIASNPPSVNVVNENAIPKQYRIPQPDKIDKKAILADLKAGKEVLGCELETEKKSLRIR